MKLEEEEFYRNTKRQLEDGEKKASLLKMLAERNITTTISNGAEYLESEQKLDKLKEYEVEKIGD